MVGLLFNLYFIFPLILHFFQMFFLKNYKIYLNKKRKYITFSYLLLDRIININCVIFRKIQFLFKFQNMVSFKKFDIIFFLVLFMHRLTILFFNLHRNINPLFLAFIIYIRALNQIMNFLFLHINLMILKFIKSAFLFPAQFLLTSQIAIVLNFLLII